MEGQNSTYKCICCQDEHPSPPTAVIHTNNVCRDCFARGIFPEFEKALKDETQYPPKWAGQEIPFSIVEHLFDDASIQAWKQKIAIYKIAKRERIMCAGQTRDGQPCGAFLGQKSDRLLPMFIRCLSCMNITCKCGAAAGGFGGHKCAQDPPPLIPEIFKDQVRGRDYQICPNEKCGFAMVLGSGCYHMICPMHDCGTEFCYLCGSVAGKGHWNLGQPCTLYPPNGEVRIQTVPGFRFAVPDHLRWGPFEAIYDAHHNGVMAYFQQTIDLATAAGDQGVVAHMTQLRHTQNRMYTSSAIATMRTLWAQIEVMKARLALHSHDDPQPRWLSAIRDIIYNLPSQLLKIALAPEARAAWIANPGVHYRQLKSLGAALELKQNAAGYEQYPELRPILHRYLRVRDREDFLDW